MSAVIPNAARPAGGRRPGTPLVALATGGMFGVLQTLLAQRCGLLRFATARDGWWGVELATLTWLSAVSVIVGVVVAGRFGRRDVDRRTDLFALASAALGCLFAVPVTSSSVAWAALYGGAVPVYRAAAHVILGIGLGTVAGLLAQRYRSVALGLLVGSVVMWVTALLSALLGADRAPVLGHPDLGLAGPGLDLLAVTAQRVGALVVAFLTGVGFGAARYRRVAEARIVSAVAGPALVAVTFLTTVPLTGTAWPWSPLPSALAAVPCAGLGAILAVRLADLARPRR